MVPKSKQADSHNQTKCYALGKEEIIALKISY